MWRRFKGWRELRKAETRYRMHLEYKKVLPYHTYPMLEEDLKRIGQSLRRQA